MRWIVDTLMLKVVIVVGGSNNNCDFDGEATLVKVIF